MSDTAQGEMERRRVSLGEMLAGAPGLIALIAMAVSGIAIAIYLITVEAEDVPLLCSSSGLVDCASVLTSSYSRVPFTSVPITVPGLLWFVGSGALAGFGLMRLRQGRVEPQRLRLAQFLWSAVGMLFVLYLVYAEIVQLHRICAWCTVIHVLTLLVFLLTLQRLQQPDTRYIAARPARVNPHSSARNVRGKVGGGAGHGAVPSRRALARTRARRQ